MPLETLFIKYFSAINGYKKTDNQQRLVIGLTILVNKLMLRKKTNHEIIETMTSMQ